MWKTIVRKKYHILKTSDNFYLYKTDIKEGASAKCGKMRHGSKRCAAPSAKQMGDTEEDVLELLDLIERGFDDIEHRIANMDKEHAKYVRATVSET